MHRFIERAAEKAVALERMLDSRMNSLVRAPDRPLEPLEIRNAILQEIDERVVPGPKGTHVFPYDEVTIELVADTLPQAAEIEAMFEPDGGVDRVVHTRLADRRCRTPATLVVRTVTLPSKPGDWSAEARYRVQCRRLPQAAKTDDAPMNLVLTLSPDGEARTLFLGADRIDIGRVLEVRDREGQLVRRNAVVIADAHDPKATVSRRHAHIISAPESDGRLAYRVYDDASRYGTRVVRKGQTIPVHPGTLGIRLKDGDELHFGAAKAVVRLT